MIGSSLSSDSQDFAGMERAFATLYALHDLRVRQEKKRLKKGGRKFKKYDTVKYQAVGH